MDRKETPCSLTGEACQVSHRGEKPTEAAREVEHCSLALVAGLTGVPSSGEITLLGSHSPWEGLNHVPELGNTHQRTSAVEKVAVGFGNY